MDTSNEENQPKKVQKSFREYYANADFKRRHLDKMKEKIECECGKFITRSNMSAHKKTKVHLKRSYPNDDLLSPEVERRIIQKLLSELNLKTT